MFRFSRLARQRRAYSVATGDVVHNWKFLDAIPVPEFRTTALQFEHEPTGARFLHLDSPHDDTNAFVIAFPTPPENSNGVAHVLEHSTLCGSQKYPVRDLFFNMMKRSLNTYMNAWTASDCTAYPFSTRNEKDFKNLMDVYLDAVFYPRLSREDFSQEGHRLEFENMEDPSSPLRIKGVVYNEMKGVASDASSYFLRKLHQYTYPNTIYSHDSGGDPQVIPTLTHDYLKNFHHTHYHPSNAYVYTYGSFDYKEHLKTLDQVFSKFNRGERKTIEAMTPLAEPVHITLTGPPEPVPNGDGDVKYAVSYLTCPSNDAYENLCLSFFSLLVFNEPRGIFFQNLIQSNLAPDFCGPGFDSSVKNTSFVIGVQNIPKERIPQIDEAIAESFKHVYEHGVDQTLIDSTLHSIELSVKKKMTNFGVNLAYGVITSWIHSDSPVESLFINKYLDRIKEEINQGVFFKRIIDTYFINNPHTVHLTMIPDPNHSDKLNQKESQMLSEINSKLSEAEKKEIIENALKLKQKQDTPTDNSILPTLTIKDISRKLPEPLSVQTDNNIMMNEQQTNGVSYISIDVNIPSSMPVEMMPYLSLFSSILSLMGAEKMNYLELVEKVDLYTGGINTSLEVVPDLHQVGKAQLKLAISSLCLDKNIEKMIELIRKIYLEPWLDSDLNYLSSILQQILVGFSNSIVSSGSSHAKKTASSVLGIGPHFDEILGGIDGFNNLRQMIETEGVEGIIEKVKQVAKFVLVNNNIRVLITSEAESMPKMKSIVEKEFLEAGIPTPQSSPVFSNLMNPHETFESLVQSFSPRSRNVFIPLPAQVNFVSTCMQGIPYYHEDSVYFPLAQSILDSNYLLPVVREKGGAYGCVSFSSINGLCGITSYRDPHTEKTLNAYRGIADWIQGNNLTDLDLSEGKLATFQSIDQPTTPHRKAYRLFKHNISDEFTQERREKLLDATLDDVRRIIGTYFNIDAAVERGSSVSTAILGGIQDAPAHIRNEQNGWIVRDSFGVGSMGEQPGEMV